MERKKIELGLLIVFLVLLIYFFGSLFQASFVNFSDHLSQSVFTQSFLGPIVFVLLSAISVIFGPLSSAPLLPAAILAWGEELSFIYLFFGWFVGNCVAYLVGFFFGYPLVSRIIEKKHLTRWSKILEGGFSFWLAFIFRFATPSETGYIFGAIRYNFIKYVIISLVAELPFAVIAVFAGQAFIRAGWILFFVLGVLWLVIILGALELLKGELKKHPIK